MAAVVFADVPGADAHDAGNRLVAALVAAVAPRGTGYLSIRPAARLPHE